MSSGNGKPWAARVPPSLWKNAPISDFARLAGEVLLYLGQSELAGRDQFFVADHAVRGGLRADPKRLQPHVGDLFTEVLDEAPG